MSRILSTLLLLAGLFAWTAIHPAAQPGPPVFRSCLQGGLLYWDPIVTGQTVQTHCIDPAQFARVALAGVSCDAPAAGVTVYAKLNDGSCLPLAAVAAPGGTASAVTAEWGETASNGPVTHYQSFFVDVTPTQ